MRKLLVTTVAAAVMLVGAAIPAAATGGAPSCPPGIAAGNSPFSCGGVHPGDGGEFGFGQGGGPGTPP